MAVTGAPATAMLANRVLAERSKDGGEGGVRQQSRHSAARCRGGAGCRW
jgi:hypothetical protein